MKTFKFIVLFTFLLSFFNTYGQESEEILEYHSEVEIQIDGSLKVTEKIKVRSTGNAIKRGIFRSFPVVYKDRNNNRVTVDFKVNEVTRDGKAEPYQVLQQGDYEVIRIGEEQVILSPDVYDYTIQYTTNRQVGFFEDFDELYWNAIGDQWDFKILEATARINLPAGANIKQFAAYAGPAGSNDCPCDIKRESDQSLFVKTNRALNPNEALTLAVAWQKGIIQEPDLQDKAFYFLRDNAGVFILGIGILLALIYYLFAWTKVSKDPHRGGIYPIFEVPEDLEAAACRYIYKMRFDSGVFVSGIVELATKNALKIIEEKRKKFRLEKLQTEKIELIPTEIKMMNSLFPAGNEVLTLSQKEHKKISNAMAAQKKDLKERFKKDYFKLNYLWLLPGILISIVTLIFAYKQTFDILLEEEQFSVIAGLVWVIFSVTFLRKVLITIMEYLDHGYVKISSFFGELFSFLFLIGIPVLFIHFFDVKFQYGFILLVLILGILNFLFFHLMKAPTVQGRKMMDELEGFRMYLNAAEKPILESFNPPGVTPEIFEKYLPYAIALGVGEAWGKAFENQLEAIYGQKDRARHYHPAWYTGAGFQASSLSGFSKTLDNSFGAALSNSASPPGSKSGSGGGGSSGGGGGGGGGGGW